MSAPWRRRERSSARKAGVRYPLLPPLGQPEVELWHLGQSHCRPELSASQESGLILSRGTISMLQENRGLSYTSSIGAVRETPIWARRRVLTLRQCDVRAFDTRQGDFYDAPGGCLCLAGVLNSEQGRHSGFVW
jgi:hypothetical protein